MTDFPSLPVTPLHISSFSMYSLGDSGRFSGPTTGAASSTWLGANTAVYYPLWLPWPYLVSRVFWGNGSAASNADFGLYTSDGTRIYSTTSQAQTPASALQYISPTPFVLAPGRYYMALAISGTTNRGWGAGAGTAVRIRPGGALQQATALPLPATATFAAYASTLVFLCGITRTASGF